MNVRYVIAGALAIVLALAGIVYSYSLYEQREKDKLDTTLALGMLYYHKSSFSDVSLAELRAYFTDPMCGEILKKNTNRNPVYDYEEVTPDIEMGVIEYVSISPDIYQVKFQYGEALYIYQVKVIDNSKIAAVEFMEAKY